MTKIMLNTEPEFGVKGPSPDLSDLKVLEKTAMLRILAYLHQGPRSLMDTYALFPSSRNIGDKLSILADLEIITFFKFGKRRYVKLTEKGKRISDSIWDVRNILHESRSHPYYDLYNQKQLIRKE